MAMLGLLLACLSIRRICGGFDFDGWVGSGIVRHGDEQGIERSDFNRLVLPIGF